MADDRRRMVKEVWDGFGRDLQALRESQARERKAPLSREEAEDNRQRAALEAALEKRRARHAEEAREADKERPGGQAAGREAKREAAPHRQEQARQPEQSRQQKRGPVRLNLPKLGDPTEPPPLDEKTRRREELKAEFRRQAEEIARRRKERGRKDRDRDRER
jgi:hypothetical protein